MENPEVEQLDEEIVCQEVMLNSMEGDTSAEAEEERKGMRSELARLRKLMAKAKRGEPTVDSDDERNQGAMGALEAQQRATPTGAATPSSSRSQHQRQQPREAPAGHSHVNDTDPVGSEGDNSSSDPVAPTTPQGGDAVNDWTDVQTLELPSRERVRKRERTATNPSGRLAVNKSRRTTPRGPSPFGSSPAGRGNGDEIFIDLTGDDDDVDSHIVPPSPQARRQQEARDEELAWLLSQDSSTSMPLASSSQGNAFDRIMNTQQLNHGRSTIDLTQPASPGRATPNGNGLDLEQMVMPGSYEASWDLPGSQMFNNQQSLPSMGSPNHPLSSSRQPPAFGMPGSMGPPQRNYGSQSFGQPGFAPASAAMPPTAPPHFNNGRVYPGAIAGSSYGNNQPGLFPRQPPMVPSQSGRDSLSRVINTTSQYNYAAGTDMFGNPLSERMNDFLQGAMHDPRFSEKELEDLLQNIRPDMDIPEKDRGQTPEGLKGTLYPHQEVALSWLTKMEDGTNKGGILADDMGLGKTISMISLMLTRPATSRPKTNLIIAPLALLRQWEDEIKNKVKPSHKMSVLLFHQKKLTTDDLLQYDVVLTTYGTLAAEFKRFDELMEQSKDRRIDFNDRMLMRKYPLLHPTKAKFHRIILDEAQCIKNKGTKTAKGAFHLQATHRWCLTGTPMMNGVHELYPLIHFLKIKPYNEWEKFSSSFGTLMGKSGARREIAMRRLRALLKAMMLRRKKNSELDGKPIIRLPPKTEEEVHVELNADELDFYKQLEAKSKILFNKYLRENTVGKNYSSILVILLRLRQACCHPHLNLDFEEQPTMMSEADMEDLVRQLEPNIVDRIKESDAFECPICYDAVQSPSFFIPCGHDSCQECLTRLIDSAQGRSIQEGDANGDGAKPRCPICRGHFDTKKCFTYEAFRKVHMPETIKKEEDVEGDDDEDSDETDYDSDESSADDADENGNLKGFIDDDDDDANILKYFKGKERASKIKKREGSDTGAMPKAEDEDDLLADNERKLKKKKKKKKSSGKKRAKDVKPTMLKQLRKEAPRNREAFKKYMAYMRKTWLPSAKVQECMRLIRDFQADGEKTIIFSQWTLLLDLIEVAMYHEGFTSKPQRYDGSMSATQRNDAAQAFRTKTNAQVILVSLRAGNAGLNLTAASRVIIMDPFWNPYIEMQAVDRAYRIGQQRNVKVYRILTQETVEDRIVKLQNDKKEIVESALDENASRAIGRLSSAELKFLFNGA